MRRLLLSILCIVALTLMSQDVFAYDFSYNSIYYKKTSDSTVSVTYQYANDRWYSYNVSTSYKGIVDIPESVIYNNKSYKVTAIADYAFYNINHITKLIIPETVVSIGNHQATKTIDSLIIKDSKTALTTSYSFQGAKSSYVYIGRNISGTMYFPSAREIILNPSITKISTFYRENSYIEQVELPSNLSDIPSYCFYKCSHLRSITIPEDIDSIYSYTFQGCDSLRDVTLSKKLVYIGISAFSNCGKLSKIDFKNSPILRCLDNDAFNGSNLSEFSIPETVDSIGTSAFANSSIKAAIIPNSLKRISNYEFSGCTQLSSVKLNSNITTIGDYAFNGCTTLTAVNLPNSITSIGQCAFAGCTSIKDFSIPASVNNINLGAFNNAGITDFKIEDGVNTISLAFGGSSSYDSYIYTFHDAWGLLSSCPIKNLYIGRNIDVNTGSYYISGYFYDLNSYLINSTSDGVNLEIGSKVTKLDKALFYLDSYSYFSNIIFDNSDQNLDISTSSNNNVTMYVDTLTLDRDVNLTFSNRLKALYIGGSAKNIVSSMFSGCTSLDTVAISANLTSIGTSAFNGCSNIKKIDLSKTSLSAIETSTFQGCTSLDSIALPSTLTIIGGNAFYNCSELPYIKLPDNLTSIGSYAFYNNTSLTSIIIPKKTTEISAQAFSSCSNLDKVFFKTSTATIGSNVFSDGPSYRLFYVPNSNYSFSQQIVSNLAVNIFEDGDYTYLPLSGASKTCEIVDWKNSAKEKNITIPNSVVYGRNTLKPIEIGKNTFYGCDIKSLSTGDNITSIDEQALYNCTELKDVNLGNGVQTIGTSAFYNCSELDTVTFGNAVKTIGQTAFYNDRKLKNIVLKDNVETINAKAFFGCSALETLTLGNSVTNIADAAFGDCANISEITSYNPEAPICVSGVFDNVDKFNCLVLVPSGSLDSYTNAVEWSDFFDIEELPFGSEKLNIAITISKYQWSTLMLPFDAEIPSGIKAYTVTDADENGCTTTEVSTFNANTPYLVYGPQGTYTFSGYSKAKNTSYTNGLLTGTHVDGYEVPIGSYVLQYHAGTGFGFYKVSNSGITLKATRCCLNESQNANAKMFIPIFFNENDDATDITSLENSDNVSNSIYTIEGKKLDSNCNLNKGMYIINNKKVIIK